MAEELIQFYQRAIGFIPEGFDPKAHFNIFRLEPYIGANAKPVPYIRRNYYKLMITEGQGLVHYADRSIEVNGVILTFSNPSIPYKWESTNKLVGGVFCIFNEAFFEGFGSLSSYEVFQPQGKHIFQLDPAQSKSVKKVFEDMSQILQSDYHHKYDQLRIKVYELIHFVLSMNKDIPFNRYSSDASERITALFIDLLERQFPIDEDHREIKLRSASDYAHQMNLHVNHLNKSIKSITQKTTSQLITERILFEAKRLLRQSDWNISHIAFALGFSEASHFSNYFKKNIGISPIRFRNDNTE